MSRELEFDGYWEGAACYSCDECGKTVKFRFDSEETAKDAKAHRSALRRKRGWITTQVEDIWHDFCGESCKNKFIRKNTI